jgi:prolyl-tRNA synthetase
MFTGANADGVHLRGVDVERDIAVGRWADVRAVVSGEPCARCGAPLRVQRGVSLVYDVPSVTAFSVLTPDGKRAPLVLDTLGFALDRALAAVVEEHHDDKGIVWPAAVAPFEAVVVVAQSNDAETAAAGERIYRDLLAASVDAVVDDRAERAGVKFRDAELVGIPVRITVGKRGLAEGIVELTARSTGETTSIKPDQVVERVQALLDGSSRA